MTILSFVKLVWNLKKKQKKHESFQYKLKYCWNFYLRQYMSSVYDNGGCATWKTYLLLWGKINKCKN